MQPILSLERLHEILTYNPETGLFTWREDSRRRIAGSVAGRQHHDGYIVIWIEGREYGAHRLAWLFATGCWPIGQIDHRNRVRDDNRFANLREATHAENQRNSKMPITNTSGAKGVCRMGNKWQASISVANRKIHLGYFDDLADAAAAYAAASLEHHGQFGRTQ